MGAGGCRLTVEEGVGKIVFDRPGRLNAMDEATLTALFAHARQAMTDDAIRVVTFEGRGDAFSAGGDVAEMASVAETERQDYFLRLAGVLHEAVGLFVRSGKPLLAGVGGVAAGAGFSLVLASDLVVASETARFTMAYTKIGLVPDGGGSFFLPRVVGHHRAMELMLTNRVLTAAEAQGWGIVNQVCAAEALTATLAGLARELAAGPTAAFRQTKRLATRSWLAGLEEQLQLERLAIAEAGTTDAFRARLGAFLAKAGAR